MRCSLALTLTPTLDRHASKRRGVSSWLGTSAPHSASGSPRQNARFGGGLFAGQLYARDRFGSNPRIRGDRLGEAGGTA